MTDEARLEDVGAGLLPASDGWFVVNVAEAVWLRRDGTAARCAFEAGTRAVLGTSVEARPFPELGLNIAVIQPGEPSTMYHAESSQEDFLVLSGECIAIIEEEERHLRAWDFVHCPPGTTHAFVGAGSEPCVLLMVGARDPKGTIVYPESQAAQARGAGVETETTSPHEAYARFPHWQPGRPDGWNSLPWS